MKASLGRCCFFCADFSIPYRPSFSDCSVNSGLEGGAESQPGGTDVWGGIACLPRVWDDIVRHSRSGFVKTGWSDADVDDPVGLAIE